MVFSLILTKTFETFGSFLGNSIGSSIGNSIGSAAASNLGSIIGSNLGSIAGQALGDAASQKLMGKPTISKVVGRRLSDIQIQSSIYAVAIPLLYGRMRIAGNIIWVSALQEEENLRHVRSAYSKTAYVSYRYKISLAIGLCEGETQHIERIWANNRLINLGDYCKNFTFYKGDEEQMPNSIIEAQEGKGNTPAYRGLSYIVIQDLELAEFGNRIPNFHFELVKKSATTPLQNITTKEDAKKASVESLITGITIIPGAGEFVYDVITQQKTPGEQVNGVFVQTAHKQNINKNNSFNMADASLAIDNMQASFPNLKWVSVVCNWFCNSLDAGQAELYPAVEVKQGLKTSPDEWNVAGISRVAAKQITYNDNGHPLYGGTINDASLKRFIKHLKSLGFRVMLYPMFFMDMKGKPWRGLLKGSANDVAEFFTKAAGYNNFITHYAKLASDIAMEDEGCTIDAFIMGSELVGLNSTPATDDPEDEAYGTYPAVQAFTALAATLAQILPSKTKLTYAADWSEYHHTEGGWYHLDKLWASPYIDMIGIDAYFPLSNAPQEDLGYNMENLIEAWEAGEGYSYYYQDEAKTIAKPLEQKYAWKNIRWWWQNYHINPDGKQTEWVPKSKPIWFTEYGFSSVDGTSNQPNIFFDKDSVSGGLPLYSKAIMDKKAQQIAIKATEVKWWADDMVAEKFLWTYDARPYPFFPQFKHIWKDYKNYKLGHWVQGKLGKSDLAEILHQLCIRAGLQPQQIDTSQIDEQISAYLIQAKTTPIEAITELRQAYFFDMIEAEGKLIFRPQNTEDVRNIEANQITIFEEDLIKYSHQPHLITEKLQESALPHMLEVSFMNPNKDYAISSYIARRHSTNALDGNFLDKTDSWQITLPMVFESSQASKIAEVQLYNQWLKQFIYKFALPYKYAYLEVGDVIILALNNPQNNNDNDKNDDNNNNNNDNNDDNDKNNDKDENNSKNIKLQIAEKTIAEGNIITIKATIFDADIYQSVLNIADATDEDEEDKEPHQEPQPHNEEDIFVKLLDLPIIPNICEENYVYFAIRHNMLASKEQGKIFSLYQLKEPTLNEPTQNYHQNYHQNYQLITTHIKQATSGFALSPLAPFNAGNITDKKNSADIVLLAGELASISHQHLLAGGNIALLGAEIIQFQTAEIIGPNKYRISNLLRGRYNTEAAINNHQIGENFTLLDDKLLPLKLGPENIGTNHTYKIISHGKIANAPAINFTYQGQCYKPFSTILSKITKQQQNFTITWKRRARKNGLWKDFIDVPPDETIMQYRITIYDKNHNMLNSYITAEQNFTYQEAMQITDFGEVQQTLPPEQISIKQISPLFG